MAQLLSTFAIVIAIVIVIALLLRRASRVNSKLRHDQQIREARLAESLRDWAPSQVPATELFGLSKNVPPTTGVVGEPGVARSSVNVADQPVGLPDFRGLSAAPGSVAAASTGVNRVTATPGPAGTDAFRGSVKELAASLRLLANEVEAEGLDGAGPVADRGFRIAGMMATGTAGLPVAAVVRAAEAST